MTTTLLPRTTARSATSTVAAYGLGRPTVVDARAAIERVYHGAEADRVWNELTGSVLVGRPGALTIEETITAMVGSSDGIVRLCGQALQIRMRSYTHLAATRDIIG